jgi:hypothetical protein
VALQPRAQIQAPVMPLGPQIAEQTKPQQARRVGHGIEFARFGSSRTLPPPPGTHRQLVHSKGPLTEWRAITSSGSRPGLGWQESNIEPHWSTGFVDGVAVMSLALILMALTAPVAPASRMNPTMTTMTPGMNSTPEPSMTMPRRPSR